MVASIALLYVGFNYLKGVDFFKNQRRYYAVYSNIGGLLPSSTVTINGFGVGRVSSIRILQERNNQILVELDIDKNIILGDSASARLDSDLLGNKSIVLEVGDITKPLNPGDTLIAKLDKALSDILTEATLPVADNLEATIRKINTILDNLTGNGQKIDSMMTNLQAGTAQINYTIVESRLRIRSVSGKLENLLDSLTLTVSNVNPLLEKFGALADSLKQIEVQTTLDKATATLESLNVTLERLKNGEGSMGKMLNDQDTLYNNLNQAIINLDKLLIHFNENPKHFLGPLGKSKKKIEKDRRKEARKNK